MVRILAHGSDLLDRPAAQPSSQSQGYDAQNPARAVRALGGFQATVDGRLSSDFGSNKARALLVFLLMESGRAHLREALASLLWPERAERAALNNLNQALFTLRRALGDDHAAEPLILSDRLTIQISQMAPLALDAVDFARLTAACRRHGHRRLDVCEPCIRRLATAVELYQGPLLHGFSLPDAPEFEEWLQVARERLHIEAVEALQHLLGAYERRDDQARVLDYGRRLLQIEPWHEGAHRALIAALAASGRRGAALRQFELCRKTLADELGVEPEPETLALAEQLRGAQPRAARPAPPPAPRDEANAFVGRAAELAAIADFAAAVEGRLLTIVGPGGVGKSRLALRAAAAAAGNFQHGVFIVPLAEAAGQGRLPALIGASLGLNLPADEGQGARLLAHLAPRELLLVLDDAEELRAEGALLTEILRRAPGVKLLVTSRLRLGLSSERVLTLAGLACPEEQAPRPAGAYEAVQLFAVRAAQLGLSLEEADLPHVAQICRLLDGLPLGVELAAALALSHSCGEIVALVERDPGALGAVSGALPPRHQSLRAVFSRSWQLLAPAARTALACLSVFQGGFSDAAALAVVGPELPLAAEGRADHGLGAVLGALRESALVEREPGGRWRLHRLGALGAAEALAAEPALAARARERHGRYFCRLLASGGLDASAAAGELANLSAAWEWACAAGATDLVAPMLRPLGETMAAAGQLVALEQTLSRATERFQDAGERLLAGRALCLLTDLRLSRGDFAGARAAALRATGLLVGAAAFAELQSLNVALAFVSFALDDVARGVTLLARAGTSPERAVWLRAAAMAAMAAGQRAEARGEGDLAHQCFRAALRAYEGLQDRRRCALALYSLGRLQLRLGEDLDQARALLTRSSRLLEESGDRLSQALVWACLGTAELRLGALEAARDWFSRVVQLPAGEGGAPALIDALVGLGGIALARGEEEQARALLCAGLGQAQALGDSGRLLACLGYFAALDAARGQVERAVTYLVFILNHPSSELQLREQAERALQGLAAKLAPAGLAVACGRSAGLTLAAVVAELLADAQSGPASPARLELLPAAA